MNKRIVLAGVVAWGVDVVYGIVVWMGLLGPHIARHEGVFRTDAAMSANVPLMIAGSLVAIIVLAMMYAKGYEGRGGAVEGLRFGLLLALFITGFVSLPIYVSFNIDTQLATMTSAASFTEMLLVGTALGVAYKPAVVPARTGVAV